MNKIIKSALWLLVSSLILAAILFFSRFHPADPGRDGNLVFANTSGKGVDFDQVVITTPQSVTSLHLQKDYWLVREADDYYAGLALTNGLFMSMNNSRYSTELAYTPENIANYQLADPRSDDQANAGTLLQTYSGTKLLDEIIIGRSGNNEMYTYALLPQSQEIWLISSSFVLPKHRYSWLQQPLLNYIPQQIQGYKWHNSDDLEIVVERSDERKNFTNQQGKVINLRLFSEQFTYLLFRDVKKNFALNLADYPQHRQLQITNFNGLITNLDFHTDASSYWVGVKISGPRLKTIQVDAYIKDNSFLYDGWYFELAPEIGRFLFNSLE